MYVKNAFLTEKKKKQYLAGLDDLLTKLAQAQDSETIRNVSKSLAINFLVLWKIYHFV